MLLLLLLMSFSVFICFPQTAEKNPNRFIISLLLFVRGVFFAVMFREIKCSLCYLSHLIFGQRTVIGVFVYMLALLLFFLCVAGNDNGKLNGKFRVRKCAKNFSNLIRFLWPNWVWLAWVYVCMCVTVSEMKWKKKNDNLKWSLKTCIENCFIPIESG